MSTPLSRTWFVTFIDSFHSNARIEGLIIRSPLGASSS